MDGAIKFYSTEMLIFMDELLGVPDFNESSLCLIEFERTIKNGSVLGNCRKVPSLTARSQRFTQRSQRNALSQRVFSFLLFARIFLELFVVNFFCQKKGFSFSS